MTVIPSPHAGLAEPALVTLIAVYLLALVASCLTRRLGTADLVVMIVTGALLAPRLHALALTGAPIDPAPESLAGWLVFILALVPAPVVAALRIAALRGDDPFHLLAGPGSDLRKVTARNARNARKQIARIQRRTDIDPAEKDLLITGIERTREFFQPSETTLAESDVRQRDRKRRQRARNGYDLAICLTLLILPGAVYAVWPHMPEELARAVYFGIGWTMLSGEDASPALASMAVLAAIAAPALLVVAYGAARTSRLDADRRLARLRQATGWLVLPAGALLPGGLLAGQIAAENGALAAALIGLSLAALSLAVPFATHGTGPDWLRFFARAGLLPLGLVGPSLVAELNAYASQTALFWLAATAALLVGALRTIRAQAA